MAKPPTITMMSAGDQFAWRALDAIRERADDLAEYLKVQRADIDRWMSDPISTPLETRCILAAWIDHAETNPFFLKLERDRGLRRNASPDPERIELARLLRESARADVQREMLAVLKQHAGKPRAELLAALTDFYSSARVLHPGGSADDRQAWVRQAVDALSELIP